MQNVIELLKAIVEICNYDFNLNGGVMVDFGEDIMKEIAENLNLSLEDENEKVLQFAQKGATNRMIVTFDRKSRALILAASQGGNF